MWLNAGYAAGAQKNPDRPFRQAVRGLHPIAAARTDPWWLSGGVMDFDATDAFYLARSR